MSFLENICSYWEALTCWAVFLRFLGFDSPEYLLKLGHVFNEGVRERVDDLEKPDTGQVALNGLVFELLLAKVADKLAEHRL